PSRPAWLTVAAVRGRGAPSAWTRRSAPITTRKERPLSTNAGTKPKRPIRRPATAGPTMRAPLNAAELRATAFTRSSFPTISTTKTWRVGMSITFAQPRRSARTATCQYWTCPLQTSAVIVNAWRARADWVARISRRLGSRSTIAPATTENIKTGANWNVPMSPSLSGEPLSCSTSHDWATDCIHVPISETSWPPEKKRKSRWLSARSASGKGIASFPACAVPAAKARWALTMIAPGELARLMQSAAPHAVLDLRERAAYERGHIYRATSLPRRLLEFRLPALVPARATPLVVCDADGRLAALALPTLGEMGYPDVRTLDGGLAAWHAEGRPPVGAESPRRMRLANPVVALENGTMGWELAGLALERGAARWAPAPSARSRAVATLTAKRVAAEDGIPFVSPDELAARLATRERQNLYVLDVRTADEYAAGHVAGAVWARSEERRVGTERRPRGRP